MKANTIIVVVIGIVIIGFLIWQWLFRPGVPVPKEAETVTEEIILKDGAVIGIKDEVQQKIMEEPGITTREIMITNGIKHSVPLEEILSGGPPKDGIPSIDNPKFISIKEAEDWLGDNEPGIAFSRGDTHRFYPYQIMVWHEIVNDTIDG